MFLENGGAIYYESLPWAPDVGLIEGATPECRGPAQLLRYQRAQDALLYRALEGAAERLEDMGYPGELGLLKNCRDVEGNVYGAQENYEVEVDHPRLVRLGTLALAPPLIALGLLLLALALVIVVPLMIVVIATSQGIDPYDEEALRGAWMRRLGWTSRWVEQGVMWPILIPYGLLLRAFAFRRIRRALLPFIASRCVITGAGSLDAEGRFHLSEKAAATRRVIRFYVSHEEHPVFDTGNLMKALIESVLLRTERLSTLLRPRQRMQLSLSDSNVAQVAEHLKIATAALMMDMAEAGALDDAPRLRDPIEAIHALSADPTLKTRVALRGGGEMSALELQRWYLERARAWVAERPAASLEIHEILRQWSNTLEALEVDPGRLVGRIDWVTKRYLMERAGAEAPLSVLKKIDLRYHELGEGGYLARLEAAGVAVALLRGEEVEAAITEAPDGTRARMRSRLIRDLAGEPAPVTVSWSAVRIGGERRRVIRLVEE